MDKVRKVPKISQDIHAQKTHLALQAVLRNFEAFPAFGCTSQYKWKIQITEVLWIHGYLGVRVLVKLLGTFSFPGWACSLHEAASSFSEFTHPQTCKFLMFLQMDFGSFYSLLIEEQSLLGSKRIWAVPARRVLQIISRLCYLLKVMASWHTVSV